MTHPYVTYMLKVISHTEPLQFHVKLKSIARDMLRGKKIIELDSELIQILELSNTNVKIIIICSESS